jgi:hypothetical protein
MRCIQLRYKNSIHVIKTFFPISFSVVFLWKLLRRKKRVMFSVFLRLIVFLSYNESSIFKISLTYNTVDILLYITNNENYSVANSKFITS